MVPHLDTVCTIHELERQHRLAEASRVHRLLATSQIPHSGARLSAGAWTPAMVLRRLTGAISLRSTVATGLSS